MRYRSRVQVGCKGKLNNAQERKRNVVQGNGEVLRSNDTSARVLVGSKAKKQRGMSFKGAQGLEEE
jgi:hypothetical protein